MLDSHFPAYYTVTWEIFGLTYSNRGHILRFVRPGDIQKDVGGPLPNSKKIWLLDQLGMCLVHWADWHFKATKSLPSVGFLTFLYPKKEKEKSGYIFISRKCPNLRYRSAKWSFCCWVSHRLFQLCSLLNPHTHIVCGLTVNTSNSTNKPSRWIGLWIILFNCEFCRLSLWVSNLEVRCEGRCEVYVSL